MIASIQDILLALCSLEEISLKRKQMFWDFYFADFDINSNGEIDQVEIDIDTKSANSIVGLKQVDNFFLRLQDIDEYKRQLSLASIQFVSILDKRYPDSLKTIDFAPLGLFLKGNLDLLSKNGIGVVGTRKPTRYGTKVTQHFVTEFGRVGLVVVSGFARGVDSTAHKTCTDLGYPTIAVMGAGLDICYPAENRGLRDMILNTGGLILSEYGLKVAPKQYHFPERNRLISGLSLGVLLAESTEKSGSQITVRCALEQNRDVFIVPGDIFSPESAGSNALLRDIPHAFVVSPDDVFAVLNIKTEQKKQEYIELNIVETEIVNALKDDELHFEELMDLTGLGVGEINNILINLEINGIVEKTSGNYYILS